MKFKGGYNIFFEGRPEGSVGPLPESDELYLPLFSRRFLLNEICVENGRQVSAGDIIAKDSNNFAAPLLAPRGGTVKLKAAANHIVLADIRFFSFHVVYALSDKLGEGEKWSGETGFIHLAVDKKLERGVKRQAFLCGPPPMIEAVTRVLEEKGIKPEDIFYDKF